ncbi:MAG: phosphoribosylformylglycinamidine cyclo-ligase [Burkholderiaceae bacterium]|jgi:phosphoribosylformylglycinamidine cyclo-ligase|nr:phosphoribosylformylglycinamidine cyclo-ligase [Betaproteobacteria bacterium]
MTEKQTGLTYRDAGVDIDAGDALVDRIKPLAKRTMRPEVMAGIGGFGALCGLPKGMKDPVLVSGTDGVGTKLMLAFALNKHDTVGIDLVAMSVNDILVQGAEPLFFLDYFACGRLSVDAAADVVGGIAKGCELSGCALIGGETAEMPGMYPDGEYDLAGFAVGVVERDQILDAKRVAEGDVLLGLASSGFHSNGYSLVRKVIERELGAVSAQAMQGIELETFAGSGQKAPLAELVMTPTRLYVKSMLAALKAHGTDIAAMAHITGGGLVGNIPRVLPDYLMASLQAGSWPLPPVMQWVQQAGGIQTDEMHRVFNCGIGMVVVVKPQAAEQVAATLTAAGERVYRIGQIQARAKDAEQTVIS